MRGVVGEELAALPDGLRMRINFGDGVQRRAGGSQQAVGHLQQPFRYDEVSVTRQQVDHRGDTARFGVFHRQHGEGDIPFFQSFEYGPERGQADKLRAGIGLDSPRYARKSRAGRDSPPRRPLFQRMAES